MHGYSSGEPATVALTITVVPTLNVWFGRSVATYISVPPEKRLGLVLSGPIFIFRS
jgi:hypothetical protein